jgi:UDP-glucose 4-epimerase
MKIIITGIAGLLGAHLHRHFLQKGHTVIGIDDLSGGYREFLSKNLDLIFYQRTLGADSIADIFEIHKPDVVYHLAAFAAEGLSPFVRCFNYQNNVIASASVINQCIKHNCKLIYTSSMGAYGNQKPPFTEEMELKPSDPYGTAKFAVEMDIKQAHELFGLRYNIVRPHNVLGIYQNIWDKYRNVIGIFIRQVLNQQPITVYGDGEQTRAFSDVEFYMEPFEKLLDGFDGEIFNIGADKYWTINQVAEIVKNTALKHGYSSSITHLEARDEVKHAYCDHSKAKNLLQFKDETDLETLIDKMFDWAKNQPNRIVQKMEYEIQKNIYSYWK